MAKKPISLGMTITIATKVFQRLLEIPSLKKEVEKVLSERSERMLTPEEFDSYWDEFFKEITQEKKK